MNESSPTHESPRISREEVINAYRIFSEKGAGDPAELDLFDPAVIEANTLYDKWRTQGDEEGAQNEERQLRHNFDKTMVYIDAGFVGKKYLEDALDWLTQDAQETEKIPDDNERTKTRDLLAAAIKKIRKLLEESN